mmetsp:Transcript_41724/g.111276  ORF Transcript_41724/g.111276 Transcript_41724/m.111276 type:complete len:85 (-) Transcript_41724:193-447(-)
MCVSPHAHGHGEIFRRSSRWANKVQSRPGHVKRQVKTIDQNRDSVSAVINQSNGRQPKKKSFARRAIISKRSGMTRMRQIDKSR